MKPLFVSYAVVGGLGIRFREPLPDRPALFTHDFIVLPDKPDRATQSEELE